MKRLHEIEAYVTGELDGAAADAFEEAMFDAPDDADLAFMDRLPRHGAVLVEHGTFDIGISRAQIDALIAKGYTVQLVDAGPPTTTQRALKYSRDTELIATCLQLGRTDVERVDVEVHIVKHQITKTIKDVLVDPTDGKVYGLCERPLAELAFGAGLTITRVRRCDGDRAVLAEWHLLGQVA